MQNNNSFNKPNNPMQKMQHLMPKETPKLLKHIVSIVCGITPMLSAIFLVGVNSIIVGGWAQDGAYKTSYGLMWGLGILLIFASIILSIIVSATSKEIGRDVIPFSVAWAFTMFGIFIIPLTGGLKFLFILILPMLWLFGIVMGGIGVITFTMIKLNKDMKQLQEDDPEVKKQMDEMMRGIQDQHQPGKTNQNNNDDKHSSEKKKKDYEDNPFVDVKPEDK